MLIHYSQASFDLLERKLTSVEKDELFDVFYRVGKRMGLKDLPLTYSQWQTMHEQHLIDDLQHSHYTDDLYKQYKKHLGSLRYWMLIESQKLVVPAQVRKLLGLGKASGVAPLLFIYKKSRLLKLDWFLKSLVLPKKYKKQIKELDIT